MRLRRGDVLVGALDQLDRDGLDNLTMQALAQSLGVRPGALYWHYEDKRALMDAMAEAIIANVDFTDDRAKPWSDRLSTLAQAIHRALLSRRDGARLVAGTFVARERTLHAAVELIHIAGDAGLSGEDAAAAALSTFYYILGYTIEEQSRQALITEDRWNQHQRETLDGLPEGIGQAITKAQNSDTFESGLSMFIAGIEKRVQGDHGEVAGVGTAESPELRAARRRIRELERELAAVRQAMKPSGQDRRGSQGSSQ